jgi:hypothetical protein
MDEDGEAKETLNSFALIRRHWPFILYLAQATREEIQCAITCVTEGQLRVICEICKNVLLNSLHLPSEQIRLLQSHKRVIRILANSSATGRSKKSILKKDGVEFLFFILPLVVEHLASLL